MAPRFDTLKQLEPSRKALSELNGITGEWIVAPGDEWIVPPGDTGVHRSMESPLISGMPIFHQTAEVRFFCSKILTPEIRLNPRR